ncbi:MAG: LSm family protein [Fimbriimonadaceae bacterium]
MSWTPEAIKPEDLKQALELFGLGFVARETYRFVRGHGSEDALPKAMWSLVASAVLAGFFTSLNLVVPDNYAKWGDVIVLASRCLSAIVIAMIAVVIMGRVEKLHFVYRWFPPSAPRDRLFATLDKNDYITVVVKDDRQYTGLLKGVDVGRPEAQDKTLVLQNPHVLTVKDGKEIWEKYPNGKYVMIPFESITSIVIAEAEAEEADARELRLEKGLFGWLVQVWAPDKSPSQKKTK